MIKSTFTIYDDETILENLRLVGKPWKPYKRELNQAKKLRKLLTKNNITFTTTIRK